MYLISAISGIDVKGAYRTIDLKRKIVMPGGIDIHSHISGGKINLARLLLPEEQQKYLYSSTNTLRSGSGLATCTSFHIGYKYSRLGYTAVFEPAVLPANARSNMIEMSDIPQIDKGCYTVLSNDDFLLNLIQKKTYQIIFLAYYHLEIMIFANLENFLLK